MKRLLCSFILVLLACGHMYGQAALGTSRFYNLPDSIELGDNIKADIYAINRGNAPYSGYIHLNLMTSKKTDLDKDSIKVNGLQPGDSVKLNVNFHANGNYVELGSNIIVVWPTGTKIVTKDSARGTVQIYETAGIKTAKNSIERVSIYPNPATQRITIQGLSSIKAVRLMSMQGKNMEVVLAPDYSIDISTLPLGVYCISVQLSDGIFYNYRLIKD